MSGLFFANWWGLVALAAPAAVVAAYLFYRRYPPRRVTGLFLWGDPARQLAGGRTLERPRFGRAFWLDFLAALLLALAVAQPGWLRDTGNLPVVILDDSFSMQARENQETARALATALLAQSARPGAVILAGEQPQLLCHPDTPAAEAAARLARYQPAQRGADLAAALRSATALYSQRLDVHFITDQETVPAVREGDASFTHRLAGRIGNLAFETLWRGRAGDTEIVHARIVNYSAQPATAVYRLLAPPAEHIPGAPLAATPHNTAFEKTLTLAPGATQDCEAAVPGGTGALLAQLQAAAGEDGIAADSRAWLLPAPSGAVSAGVYGLDDASARYVRLALAAAGAQLSAASAAPATAVPAAAAGGVPATKAMANAGAAQAGVAGAGETSAASAALLVTSSAQQRGRLLTLEIPPAVTPLTFSPPFVVDLADPLCRDVNLGAGYWTVPLDQPKIPRGSWLIFAGQHPLLWRAEAGRYVLNVVPSGSSLVQTAAWPALFANLVTLARERLPGLRKTVYLPGQGIDYRASAPDGRADAANAPARELQLFGGDRLLAAAPAEGFLRAPFVAGWYELRQDGEYRGALAVLPLYGAESDTRTLAAVRRDLAGGGADGEAGRAPAPLFWLPLLLGVGLLVLNWRLGEER